MEKGDYVKIRAGRNEGAFGTIKRWDTDAHDCCVLIALDETAHINHPVDDWYGVDNVEPTVDTEYQEAVKLFGEDYFA